MRVISIGNFGTGWDGSICDEEHITGALEELGHEVIRMQRDQVGAFTGRCDFVLISQWDGYPPNLATTLKTNTLGAPIVYWAFDYQADGQEWHERLVTHADLYLSKRIADSKYPNWQWLSQDFSPQFLDRYPLPVEKDIDVLFTGSYLPWATERNDTLVEVNKRFNLVIHSVNEWPGWNKHLFKDVRPPIMDEGLPELYARAKVVLSIDHTLEAGYWSDRNAQIMACGFRPLFRYIPLSESTFHDHVDYFYSIEGCLNKIADLLEAQGEAIEIMRAYTYQYAQTHMKVKNRVQDLLTVVEGVL